MRGKSVLKKVLGIVFIIGALQIFVFDLIVYREIGDLETVKQVRFLKVYVFIIFNTILIFIVANEILKGKGNERLLNQFKQIFDISNNMLSLVDRDFIYRYVNKAYHNPFGLEPEEIIGKKVEDIFGKELFNQILKDNLEKAFKGETVKYQYWANGQNGSYFMDATYKPFIDNNGIINGVLTSTHEITGLKLSEIKVWENEKKIKLIIDNIPVVVYKKGLNYNTIYVSENVERICGYTQNEIYENGEKLWFDRVHPDDSDYIHNQFNALFSENIPFDVKYRIKNKSGNWIWLHDLANLVIIENGEQYAYGVFYDITKIKEIENELIESKDKFHKASIINPSPLLISSLKEGKIAEVNYAFLNTFNYSLEEIIGKTTNELGILGELEEVRNVFFKQLKPENSLQDMKLTLTAKNGKKLHFIANTEVIYIKNEPNFFTIFNNITEIKKANQKLEFYKNRLEDVVKRRTRDLINLQQQLIHSEKMASIELLSSGIAHEINNPINYISGGIMGLKKVYENLKYLVHRYKENVYKNDQNGSCILHDTVQLENAIDKADRMLDGINEGVIKTKNIINSLHIFSGNSEDKFEQVSIPELIHSALTLLFNEFKNRIVINEQYDMDSVVFAIPVKLQQVFINILSNAIQAIPQQGEMSICTKWNSTNDKLNIIIADSGIGIPQEIQKRIFDPFFTTREVGSGTGLGLYLSYTYIKQHFGKIKVKSQIGKGSEFTIELPVNAQSVNG